MSTKRTTRSSTKIYKKLTKKQSGYIGPHPGIRCGTCKYFFPDDENPNTGHCPIVNGLLYEYSCCNLWTAPKTKTNIDFICGRDIEDILDPKILASE